MTRLDDEYDPAERHDLKCIRETRPATGRPGLDGYRHFYACQCGDVGDIERDEQTARREHDRHRDDALGIGCG